MPFLNRCANCDSECPPGVPDGLCPRCLIRLGLEAIDQAPSAPHEDRFDGSTSYLETVIAPHSERLGLDGELLPIVRQRNPVLLDEIARGGMGVIFRGRDQHLNRDLAIKVLRESVSDHSELYQRFVTEARITSQLQHPGIVPIYDLGTLENRRPFFSMKLVKGRTLAEVLRARANPEEDRPHLLRVVLQVAQTLAYAHAHRVIHQDLKPDNIMIGKYDEVLIMDWGLAELVSQPDGATGSPEGEGPEPRAVVGTPAYMSPERFASPSARLDERVDVFALGAILYEILAGRPIYEKQGAQCITQAGESGQLTPRHDRLDELDLDPTLVKLTKSCLSFDPNDRPRHAGEVANRLASYLEGLQEQLRQAELSRVAAQARVDEEAKRRRLVVLLCLFAVTLVVFLALGAFEWRRREASRRDSAELVLRELELHRDQAASDPSGDPAVWRSAFLEAGRADLLLADAPEDQRQSLETLTTQINEALDQAERDAQFLVQLERVHHRDISIELEKVLVFYLETFTKAGFDLIRSDPLEVGRAIASRPSEVRTEIVACLDSWLLLRRTNVGDPITEPTWKTIQAAANAADSDPLAVEIRQAIVAASRDALEQLTQQIDLSAQPVANLRLLGQAIEWRGMRPKARAFLQQARQLHPQDFWINFHLSEIFEIEPSKPDLVFAYASSAVAIRPDSTLAHFRLGVAQTRLGQYQAAEAEYREAIRLDPEFVPPYRRLALLLYWNLEKYDDAIQTLKKSIELDPERTVSGKQLIVSVLLKQDRVDEAIEELNETLNTYPKAFPIWLELGSIHITRGDHEQAMAAFDRAEPLAPPGSHARQQLDAARSRLQVRD